MIPVSSKRVRLDGLHPEFVARLERFFGDSRVRGRVVVCSGVRTVREQAVLFDRYRNKGGVLAADPSRVFGGGWVGSWHMVQPDGFGYAVDLRLTGWTDWGWFMRWRMFTGFALPSLGRIGTCSLGMLMGGFRRRIK